MNLDSWELYVDPAPTGHPIERMTRVKILVDIRLCFTGETRRFEDYAVVQDRDVDHPNVFGWSEGNYACDCNRHLFFARAGGREAEDDQPCGDGVYLVNLSNPKTGVVYYREFQ